MANGDHPKEAIGFERKRLHGKDWTEYVCRTLVMEENLAGLEFSLRQAMGYIRDAAVQYDRTKYPLRTIRVLHQMGEELKKMIEMLN